MKSKLIPFLIAFVMVFASSLQATIFVKYASGNYTNALQIAPGQPFNMDLDQNSFVDYEFALTQTGPFVNPMPNNEYSAYNTGEPRALNQGNPIAAPYAGGSGDLAAYFSNPSYKFFGMKMQVGQDFIYGWAEVLVDNGALFLNRYAYSDVVNVPIEGGQVVGFAEDFAADFDLTVQGRELLVRTELYRKYPLELKMATISGKTVASFDIEASEKRVLLQELSAGVYLITVASRGELVYQKKVFVN